MIAKYNEKYYFYVCNKKISNIVTRKSYKADKDFTFDEGVYYRKVDPDELTDVFEVSYWVAYDTGIVNLPKEWEVGKTSRDINGDTILIRYSNGLIPNWKAEEKDVCVNYIKKSDITAAKIVKSYSKKDGVQQVLPLKEEENTDVDDFIEKWSEFKRDNL